MTASLTPPHYPRMGSPDPRMRDVSVTRHGDAAHASASDRVATEDPLEIQLAGRPLAVTMRTPGDDEDLVYGFLLTEGILIDPAEISAVERVGRDDESRLNVRLRNETTLDPSRFQRSMFVSSSCGICGKGSIDAVRVVARPAAAFVVRRAVVASLTSKLRARQPTFDQTGGLHAAGLFDLDGNALAVREDVGRHNAVDKAIGAAARETWPLPQSLLVVSGRQSFEIVQKAAVVGIGGVVGVSAPSSLAVELATELGMLLVGFARGPSFNVYAAEDRLRE